jgi:4-hydroxy-4-methyl-2-oxoglutarate aldolase
VAYSRHYEWAARARALAAGAKNSAEWSYRVSVVVRNIRRVDAELVAGYSSIGVATIHEAQGRKGLMASYMRPVYRPCHIAGSAVTCDLAPGDNWTLHVAIEQCRKGDVLVAAPTSPCEDGYFGELLATQLKAWGVVGLILEAGCRDVDEIAKMGFPVWSRAVCAQGTVKETPGNVNLPLVCAGQLVNPGDLIVADSDGVVVVRRKQAEDVLNASREREEKESKSRARYARGELSLDVNNMRGRLAEKGLKYIDTPPED